MAQVIGNVKSFETGTFFAKSSDGQIRQLQVGDLIYDGEYVYGAATNTADAKIVIDVLLAGAGDLVLGGTGALTFDTSVLAGMFSHNDAVVYVNSVKEALAAVAPDDTAANEDITDAGETAAGESVTDTERAGDIFAARTGAVGDVTTSLNQTGATTLEVTLNEPPLVLLEEINALPVAIADVITTAEDTVVSGTLATNDIPSADGGNVWALATQAANGTVVVNTDGTYTYTPNENYNGPDSFTYTLTDAGGDISTATVGITVNPANDAPVAVDDNYETGEDTALTLNPVVQFNDSDVDGDTLTVKSFTQPENGTVTTDVSGNLVYTPDENFNGSDTFTYVVTDAEGKTDEATVGITVNPLNDDEGLILSTDILNVSEAGLNPLGTSSAGSSEQKAGSFTVSDPDGLADIKSVTIGTTTFTIGQAGINSLGDIVNHTIDTGYGKVTITDYNNGIFNYNYVLDTAVDNNDVTGAIDTSYTEKFTVSVSDGIGNAASQEISVVIADDAPLGSANSGIVANTVNATLTGSAGIVFGADDTASPSPYNIGISSIPAGWSSKVVGGDIYLWAPGDSMPAGTAITNASSKFTLDANGQYTFTVLQELEPTITIIPLSLTTLAPPEAPSADKFVTDLLLPNGETVNLSIHSSDGFLVNSSNQGLGVSNPQVNAGEKLYFDFSQSVSDLSVNVGKFSDGDTLVWTAYTYNSVTSDYTQVATGSYDATAHNDSTDTEIVLSQSLDSGSLVDGFDRVLFGAQIDSDKQDDNYNIFSANISIKETILPNDANFVFSIEGVDSDNDTAISYIGVNIDANETQGGDAGDDVLSGNGILIGGAGDDTLTGGTDAGYLFGGDDNDTLTFDTNDKVIDGGSGIDTLVLTTGSNIDFGVLDSTNNPISNIEAIDLSVNGDHQLLNISHNDILEITGLNTNATLTVLGDTATDIVSVDNVSMDYSGLHTGVMFNGESYDFNIYTSSIDPTVILRVENSITDTLV